MATPSTARRRLATITRSAAVVFLLLSAASTAVPGQERRVVLVNRDNIDVRESCTLVFSEKPITDADGDGVIRIEGVDDIEIKCSGVLQGAASDAAPESLEGFGVRIRGASNIRLTGLSVRGFRAGVYAGRTDGLRLIHCDVSDNRAQRLKSTPQHCDDGADWLTPHDNDRNEWLSAYGAGIYIEDSRNVRLEHVLCRRTQNGVVFDRVEDSTLVDSDCSFLSGWGLALWRSSGNTISRNAFDFCIRGYSHGVYNRGQDSAGILLFEQCSRNRFLENSVTHGGDGLFGFAGREALGERPAPPSGFDPTTAYRRLGCNDNLFLRNDFSFAAAHGLELTFSFGNRICENRFEENAICGVWAGYSQDTRIEDNSFVKNGGAGYGLERGGVNIEHGSGNRIVGNVFDGDRCGVHLWGKDGGGFREKPWGRANPQRTAEVVARNRFFGVEVPLHLRNIGETVWTANVVGDGATPLRLENATTTEKEPSGDPEPLAAASRPSGLEVPGRMHPREGRARLRGRDKIVMTPYGPWDHVAPSAVPVETSGGRHLYALHGIGDTRRVTSVDPTGRFNSIAKGAPFSFEFGKIDRDGAVPFIVRAAAPGVTPYTVQIGPLQLSGVLVDAAFDVVFFPWPADPRTNEAAWRNGAEGPGAVRTKVGAIDFPFGHGSPSDLRWIDSGVKAAKLPADRFGVIASTGLHLPVGRWRFVTQSDDGIRLKIDGKVEIDDWTWHGPKRHETIIVAESPRHLFLELAHFEIDGFSTLSLRIEPAP